MIDDCSSSQAYTLLLPSSRTHPLQHIVFDFSSLDELLFSFAFLTWGIALLDWKSAILSISYQCTTPSLFLLYGWGSTSELEEEFQDLFDGPWSSPWSLSFFGRLVGISPSKASKSESESSTTIKWIHIFLGKILDFIFQLFLGKMLSAILQEKETIIVLRYYWDKYVPASHFWVKFIENMQISMQTFFESLVLTF